MVGDVFEIHGLEKGWDAMEGMKCILRRRMGYNPYGSPALGWCEVEVPENPRSFPWYIHDSNLREVPKPDYVNSVW